MTTPKRRYIDELMDGIRFSSGGPVSISLETAKRFLALRNAAHRVTVFAWPSGVYEELEGTLGDLEQEMPEPKP